MRADGSEFPAEVAIEAVQGAEGKVIIGYLRDITQRHQAEEQRHLLESQLRQAQKMEAIGQLTGGIAHDFNTILTAMQGYVLLARERVETHPDAKLIRYLERAQQSGQRARDLIQQMLTFSRGQHGEPRAVRLVPLIREWVGLLESTLPSSVEIRVDLEQDIPAVNVDPIHLEQVLTNLCINARDAMQGQGTITIQLRRNSSVHGICASCRQPVTGNWIELSVHDTGCGISPDVQERMFEPFFSTKAVGRGSGMGLSMVHGIVHEYGGHLLVESGEGAGTTLRVLLRPLTGDAALSDERNTAEIRSVAPRLAGHLLLVDDEVAVSEFMQDLLEDWGLTVTVRNSSVDACRTFSDDPQRFDLVILDQTMPRMTGLEVAQHLLSLRPDLPVILYTGYNADISEASVRRHGIRALVSKPVDTMRLHTLVQHLLAASPNG